MAVTAKSFQLWRSRIAPDDTVSELCRKAGIKRSTLGQQVVRGKVAISTIVDIARAYGLHPAQELGNFDGYRDLPAGIRGPTSPELISQVSHIDILRLVVARSEDKEAVGREVQLNLASFPHRNSVRAWIDAVDQGDLRQGLAARTGIAPQNLSAQLTAGRLTPELAVEAARFAKVSLASGLVVTGLLTPEEGGWPVTGRNQALGRLSDTDLVLLARDRLDVLGKSLKKVELANSRDQDLWENLG
ncbi:helix-turn-helix transcriptional regulator [Arthrobacter sp. H20]|uniref:helix-turn-helix domain-containing protein n=1 Tax=Arthrobacter sp. H20 TaxID=1267981 RepID=UPI000479159A|nr:helix-turn-helix transcriptional regulator [Arthrobacter sp. H20]